MDAAVELANCLASGAAVSINWIQPMYYRLLNNHNTTQVVAALVATTAREMYVNFRNSIVFSFYPRLFRTVLIEVFQW